MSHSPYYVPDNRPPQEDEVYVTPGESYPHAGYGYDPHRPQGYIGGYGPHAPQPPHGYQGPHYDYPPPPSQAYAYGNDAPTKVSKGGVFNGSWLLWMVITVLSAIVILEFMQVQGMDGQVRELSEQQAPKQTIERIEGRFLNTDNSLARLENELEATRNALRQTQTEMGTMREELTLLKEKVRQQDPAQIWNNVVDWAGSINPFAEKKKPAEPAEPKRSLW